MLLGKRSSLRVRDAFFWWKNNNEKFSLAIDLHESGPVRIE